VVFAAVAAAIRAAVAGETVVSTPASGSMPTGIVSTANGIEKTAVFAGDDVLRSIRVPGRTTSSAPASICVTLEETVVSRSRCSSRTSSSRAR
jgi:hypothetical protein